MKKQKNNQNNRSLQRTEDEHYNAVNSSRNDTLGNKELATTSTSSNSEELELVFTSTAVHLSETDQIRLRFASALAVDIFSDPNVAQEFAENPTAYMEMRELSFEGDLDYGIIQMALAFADDEIRQKIQDSDIDGFVTLCKEKGLLTIPVGIGCENSAEIIRLIDDAGLSDRREIFQEEGAAVEVLLVAVAIAAINIAALLNVIANINIGVNVNVLVNTDTIASGYSLTEMSDMIPSPIMLWAILNEDIESSYIVLNEVADDYFTQIDSYLTKLSPTYASDEDYRNQVQVFVKANIIKSLM